MIACGITALLVALFYALAIYGLMRDHYESRRLNACGLDYYMSKDLLQKQLHGLTWSTRSAWSEHDAE